MFGKKKKIDPISYDRDHEQPALKTSICTGERVAGFVNVSTGRFRDYMLIRNDKELQAFCSSCSVAEDELKKIV
jgi:hypothetical protein